MVGHFCVNLLITSWSLAGLWHDWSFKRTFISLGRIEIKKMVDGWTFFVLFTSWSPAGLWLTWEHLDRARSGSGTEWPSVSRWSVGSSDRSSAPGSHRTRYVPTPSEPAEKKEGMASYRTILHDFFNHLTFPGSVQQKGHLARGSDISTFLWTWVHKSLMISDSSL